MLYVVGDPDLVEHFKRRRCIPATAGRNATSGHAPSACRWRSACPCSCPATGCIPRRPADQQCGRAGLSLDGSRVAWGISLSGGSGHDARPHAWARAAGGEAVTSQLRERERIRELAIKNQYMRALVGIRFAGHRHRGSGRAHRGGQQHGPQAAEARAGLRGQVVESVGEHNITGYLKKRKGKGSGA